MSLTFNKNLIIQHAVVLQIFTVPDFSCHCVKSTNHEQIGKQKYMG